ncbi:MAG: helix-turn-helix domain-containing protein [Oscillospiraceae bacterium]|nr:helix-turn-helix domain-containing protein [Oscillospiraceae bacterium]
MKLLLGVNEAAEALGISRSKLYELIHAEAFPTMSIGGRRLIPVSGLERWIEDQMDIQSGSAGPGKVYELRKGG